MSVVGLFSVYGRGQLRFVGRVYVNGARLVADFFYVTCALATVVCLWGLTIRGGAGSVFYLRGERSLGRIGRVFFDRC